MTTKQKILKEIDNMPDKILHQAYQYLHLLNSKFKKLKAKKDVQDTWQEINAKQFLEGYNDKDAVYDRI